MSNDLPTVSKVGMFLHGYRHDRLADWMYQQFECDFFDAYQKHRIKPSKDKCYDFIMRFLHESLCIDKHYGPVLSDFIQRAESTRWSDMPSTEEDLKNAQKTSEQSEEPTNA